MIMEVVGYENYLIYDDGRVLNQKYNRFLKEITHSDGYKVVNLYREKGKIKMFKIHRLVALHYIPNPDNKPQVDHIDGDKTNNDVSNLRWATSLENNNAFQKIRTDNTSGIKNISYDKFYNCWKYQKNINTKRHQKYFKTLEEAVEYKLIMKKIYKI